MLIHVLHVQIHCLKEGTKNDHGHFTEQLSGMMSVVGADGTCAADGGEMWNGGGGQVGLSPGCNVGDRFVEFWQGCGGAVGAVVAVEAREKTNTKKDGRMEAWGPGGVLVGRGCRSPT